MRDLFFLSGAEFTVRRSLIQPGPLLSPEVDTLCATVAVCVRDDGDLVLIDAGLSEQTCANPAAGVGRLRAKLFGIRTCAAQAIAPQLEALGFSRLRVKAIVATHCHFDHIGGLVDFPKAELITTGEELHSLSNAVFSPGYFAADLSATDAIRLVRLGQGRRFGFSSSLDLFDDGDIVLLDAEGHTHGHLAVALRGPQATYLHVGDAIYMEWEYGFGFGGPCRLAKQSCADRRALDRTLRVLRACGSEKDAPIIVPAHDRNIFEQLPHRPGELAGEAPAS